MSDWKKCISRNNMITIYMVIGFCIGFGMCYIWEPVIISILAPLLIYICCFLLGVGVCFYVFVFVAFASV